MDVWSSLLALSGGPTFSELLGNGKPIRSSLELIRWIVRPSPAGRDVAVDTHEQRLTHDVSSLISDLRTRYPR